MSLFRRSGGPPADVLARARLPRGERVLASAPAVGGPWLLGTRQSLVLVLPDTVVHLPWEQIEDASWEQEERRLSVTGVGTYGQPRPSYVFTMEDPALLLQLVRERVTASIVLQRRFPVLGGLGLTVIGRRSPVGGPVAWMHAYDRGLDPHDPEVSTVADAALEAAKAEVGDDPI